MIRTVKSKQIHFQFQFQFQLQFQFQFVEKDYNDSGEKHVYRSNELKKRNHEIQQQQQQQQQQQHCNEGTG